MEKSLYSAQQKRLQVLLRQIRIEAGLRQVDLAVKLDEPQSFVSKYEKGERRLDLLEVRAICYCVGITLCEFVRRLEDALAEDYGKL